MEPRTVAFVAPPETGHFARLRAPIVGVVAAGWRAAVFTHAAFRPIVEACGATFHDLYGPYPMDAADTESNPRGMRQTSYAGRFADEVAELLRAVDPALIVYDGFALVAPVAARRLGVPYVCACAGHNLRAERFREAIHRDVDVRISDACRAAVATLRDRYGLADANPFSYMDATSPFLNLYCEPDEFLAPDMRARLEPVECIGSLPPPGLRPEGGPSFDGREPGLRNVYLSFGTVVWRFFAREAGRAMRDVTRALSARGDVRVLASLGGHDGELPDLAAPRVRVEPYVDQWRTLAETDLFVTHHGLNSTHEAVARGVPMISYPFFWDQPGLAAKCAELGFAERLVPEMRAPVTRADVDGAVERLDANLDERRERLAEAATWERRVVARRPEVVARMLSLARPR